MQKRTEKEHNKAITYLSDGTIICLTRDTRTCFFADGTTIESKLDQSEVRIGHRTLPHPIVRFRMDLLKANEHNIIGISSSLAFVGSSDVIKRAVDSQCTELFFDNGFSAYTFLEKMETTVFN